MTDRVVIDASAAIAILRREPGADAVEQSLHRLLDRIVPGCFWLEIVNVLVRRHRWPAERVVEAIRDLDDLSLVTVDLDRATLLLTLEHAIRWGLATYDAVYLAVADATDSVLLTLDHDLATAAGVRAVPLAGAEPPRHRSSEDRAPYGEPIDWARFGPYLAKLRAEARGGRAAAGRD